MKVDRSKRTPTAAVIAMVYGTFSIVPTGVVTELATSHSFNCWPSRHGLQLRDNYRTINPAQVVGNKHRQVGAVHNLPVVSDIGDPFRLVRTSGVL
ncbi:hypothetical protein J6590_006115 [Homalodisca vitripennis]|nr:hypothetical protein J6590_006115 [Homalodisca vitripennis]